MRKYLFLIGLLILIESFTSSYAIQSKECDDNCMDSVKSLLSDSKIAGGRAYFSSWSEKAAHRLGDRVAVGILKIHKSGDLTNPKNIRIILPVIREAFLYPKFIEMEVDKEPIVSLSLLRTLERCVKDPSLKEQIKKTIKFLSESTKNL